MIRLVLVALTVACSNSPPGALPADACQAVIDAAACPPAAVRYPCAGLPCVALENCAIATPTSLPVCECTVRALSGSSLTQDVIVDCLGAP